MTVFCIHLLGALLVAVAVLGLADLGVAVVADTLRHVADAAGSLPDLFGAPDPSDPAPYCD
jgi:hypothetical protein